MGRPRSNCHTCTISWKSPSYTLRSLVYSAWETSTRSGLLIRTVPLSPHAQTPSRVSSLGAPGGICFGPNGKRHGPSSSGSSKRCGLFQDDDISRAACFVSPVPAAPVPPHHGSTRPLSDPSRPPRRTHRVSVDGLPNDFCSQWNRTRKRWIFVGRFKYC